MLLPSAFLRSQWVQQSLPVSGLINDISFIDANTGFVSMDTPALLKTTNGGTNWSVIKTTLIYHIQFLDNLTGYAHGYVPGTYHRLYKTIDGSNTWDSMFIGVGAFANMSFINKDTGWIGGYDGNSGSVWRTTNGGQTLQQQFTFGGSPIQFIFFAKQRYGNDYYGWYTQNGLMSRTTNSGVNWNLYTNLPNQNAGSIFFLNKDTGWVTNYGSSTAYIMHTTNNGTNWILQNLPVQDGLGEIIFINPLKGWAGAAFNKVYATTNGGLNWGYQTVSIPIAYYFSFIDSLTGWCGYNGLAKTTNSGGNIVFNGIQQISNEIPTDFKLYQNYPNPFNPITNIKYQIVKSNHIKLIIYDMLGREITVLVNEIQEAGVYLVDWNANALPSGTYFYMLITESFVETKKMILIK